MRYINTKTGAIIDSPCAISGGDWVAEETTVNVVVDTKKEIKVAQAKKLDAIIKPSVSVGPDVDAIEEDIEGMEDITIKQIKQELDAFGIKYNPRAKKQELYDLMMQGR